MTARIENLTDKPIWLRMNSGATVSIAPRSQSIELHEHEIEGNPTVQKLIGQRTIARSAGPAASTSAPHGKSNESKSAKHTTHDKPDKVPAVQLPN